MRKVKVNRKFKKEINEKNEEWTDAQLNNTLRKFNFITSKEFSFKSPPISFQPNTLNKAGMSSSLCY